MVEAGKTYITTGTGHGWVVSYQAVVVVFRRQAGVLGRHSKRLGLLSILGLGMGWLGNGQ